MKIHNLKPWLDCVDKENYFRLLDEMSKCPSGEEQQLLVCNCGGDCDIAYSFFDVVVQSKINLTTIGSGELASAAIIIWLAGKRRLLTPHTMIFFHEIGINFKDVRFDITELKSRIKQVSIQQEFGIDIIRSRSGKRLTRKQIISLMKDEAVLKPKDAIRLGLAHGITQ